MLRIKRVAPIGAHRVRLTLTNGDVVERDVEALLWGSVFEQVRREAAQFEAVSVEAGTLVWPGGADIDPDVLIWGGAAPADPRSRPPGSLRLRSPTAASPDAADADAAEANAAEASRFGGAPTPPATPGGSRSR